MFFSTFTLISYVIVTFFCLHLDFVFFFSGHLPPLGVTRCPGWDVRYAYSILYLKSERVLLDLIEEGKYSLISSFQIQCSEEYNAPKKHRKLTSVGRAANNKPEKPFLLHGFCGYCSGAGWELCMERTFPRIKDYLTYSSLSSEE